MRQKGTNNGFHTFLKHALNFHCTAGFYSEEIRTQLNKPNLFNLVWASDLNWLVFNLIILK